MAIVFKNNPMPRTGAIYVTNPRKAIPRRQNSPKNRWVYGQVLGKGKVPSRLSKKQKTEIMDIRNGRAGSASQKSKATAAALAYDSGTGKAGTFKKTSAASRKAYASKIKSGETVPAWTQRKTTAKKRAAKKPSAQRTVTQRGASKALTYASLTPKEKKQAMLLVSTASSQDEFVFFAQNSNVKKLNSATKTALKSLYSQILKSNPKRRTAMAIAKRKNPKGKTAKTGQWKGRMISYKTFGKRLSGCGLTSKQKSSLWAKYKSTGKLPSLAASKAKSASKSTKVVTAKNGKKMYYLNGKLTSKAKYLAARKRKAAKKPAAKKAPSKKASAQKKVTAAKKSKVCSSPKTRAGAQIQKLRKQLGLKPAKLSQAKFSSLAKRQAIVADLKAKPVKKKVAKKQSRKSVAQRKTTSRKMTAWQKHLKKFGGRGLSNLQMKRLYRKSSSEQSIVAERLKKTRVRKGESKSSAKRRYKKRAKGMTREHGAGQRRMGPYLIRLNPLAKGLNPFAMVTGLITEAQSIIAELPFVGYLAPYVMPLGLGATVAGVHFLGGKYLGPRLQRIPELAKFDKIGYTLVGGATAVAIKAGQRFGMFESSSADQIATLAILTGAFVDALDYLRNQKSESQVNAIAGVHLGDGGQYFVAPASQGTVAPIRRHMKTLAPTQSDYSAIVAPLSGAAGTASAPSGYGAMMYTGAGY